MRCIFDASTKTLLGTIHKVRAYNLSLQFVRTIFTTTNFETQVIMANVTEEVRTIILTKAEFTGGNVNQA